MADIKLRFGVEGDRSLSEGSGKEISDTLNWIVSEINKDPYKIKFTADPTSIENLSKSIRDAVTDATRNIAVGQAVTIDPSITVNPSKTHIPENPKSIIAVGTKEYTVATQQLDRLDSALKELDRNQIKILPDNFQGQINKLRGDLSKGELSVESFTDRYSELLRILNTPISTADKYSLMAKAESAMASAQTKLNSQDPGLTFEDGYDSKSLQGAISEVKELTTSFNNGEISAHELVEAMSKLRYETSRYSNAVANASNAEKEMEADAKQRASSLKRVQTAIDANVAAQKRFSAASHGETSGDYNNLVSVEQKLRALKQQLDDNSFSAEKLNKELDELVVSQRASMSAIASSGKGKLSWFDKLSKGIDKYASWFSVSTIFMETWQAMRRLVSITVELDEAMTELKKVTNETDTAYKAFLTSASARAKKVGSSLVDVVSATADFARLGNTIAESEQLADAALVYKNVGDGISDITQATESIIATMQAFGMEASQAMSVVDKFNNVGNNFAISSGGIGDALLRSAAAMKAANNTLDETIALITAANTIVQNPDVVGTTMKTVSMYLRAAKTEAEDAGESTEGMANSVSELRDEIMQLTGKKVDILEPDGSFKSTYDILKALSEVWGELSDTSQANILEMVGGKRNANVVSSLLENFDVAARSLETSAQSAGSALKENEIYLESISGKLQAFSATFQSLSSHLIDTGLVKGIISIGTGLLEAVDYLAALQALFPITIGSVIALTQTYKGLARAQTVVATMDMFEDDKIDVEILIARINSLTEAERRLLKQRLEYKFVGKNADLANERRDLVFGSGVFDQTKSASKMAGSSVVLYTTFSKIAKIGGVVLGFLSKALGVISIIAAVASTIYAIGNKISGGKWEKAITKLFDSFKSPEERLEKINAGWDELTSKVEEASGAYIELKKSSDEIIPRFVKLSEGVNKFGENTKLTDEEYQEFLSLNNQLAELFPDLNRGYDSNGNAMLALSYSADTLTESLNALIEAQRLSANKEIAKNLPEVTELVDGRVTAYDEIIQEEKSKRKEWEDWIGNNHTLLEKGFIQRGLTKKNAERWQKELLAHGVEAKISQTEGEVIYTYQIEVDAGSIRAADRAFGDFVSGSDKVINYYEGLKDAAWDSAYSTISAWMQTEDKFIVLSDEIQSVAQNTLRGIDFGNIIPKKDESKNEAIQRYVRDTILYPLSFLKPDVQKAFGELISTDALAKGEITRAEYVENVQKAFNSLTEGMDDTAIKSFEEALVQGYKEIGIEGNNFSEIVNGIATEWSAFIEKINNSSELTDAFDGFKESVDILKQAKNEIESTGSISSETYNKLIGANEDYADIIEYTNGKITLNKDKLAEHAQALMDKTSIQMLANNATEDEIGLLYQYAGGLTATQSAVKTVSDSISDLVSRFKSMKDGDVYGVEDIADLVEEYPELKDNIIKTAEGYKVEEEAIRDLIKARLELLKTDPYTKEMQATVPTASPTTLTNIHNIFEEFSAANGRGIASWDEYKRAWESYKGVAEGTVDNIDSVNKRLAQQKTYVEYLIAEGLYADAVLKELENYEGNKDKGEESETWFDRRLREHKHNVAMEKETTEEYLKWLESANERAWAEEIIDKDTYYSNLEELYNGGKELFQDYLSDIEHQIEMMNNQGSDSSSIIPMYQEMISAVEDEVDKYHAAGLTDNDAYIQELKSQWWTYRDELLDVYGEALDANITDYEHDIFMLEQHEGSADEIIAIYRKMQEEVHATANEYRALGLAEDNDLIQELQQKWWEYQESIVEARREAFNNDIDAKKFGIETLKQEGGSSTEIIDSWKSILSDINAEIAYYSEAGYSSSHEIMRELTEQVWETKEELVSAIKAVVEEINSAVDGFQNVYSTLTDAAKEYASTGYLSVDSLQAILELEPKYLAYLTDENGQLVINEQALQNVIAAKTEELAAETALAYAKQVLLAVEQNDIATLTSLTQATAASSGATWDMAYATIGLAKAMGVANGMEASYFDDAVSYINKMQSLSQTAASTVSAYYQTLDEGYVSQKDGLDKILQATQDMIKWEQDQMIEALEKEKDLYNDLIDQKKEMIELTKEEHDHERDTADKLEEIARLQSKIDQLSLDDSREAQAQKRQLEEELNELQKGFADDQADYAYDVQIDALDREKEAYNEAKDDEIEGLRNMLDSAEELYQAAIARINGGWDTLYNDLISWNAEYGSMLESELVSAWDAATAAVQRYGSFVDALEGVDSYTNLGSSSVTNSDGSVTEYGDMSIANPGDIIGSMKANSLEWYVADDQGRNRLYAEQQALADQWESTFGEKLTNKNGVWYRPNGDVLYSLTEDEVGKTIVDEMKRNGEAWNATENESERRALEARNEELAATLSSYLGEEITRGADGVWYLRGKKLFDAYHSGGIVGRRPTLEQNEMMAVLEEGEAVLDEKKERSLYKIIDFVDYLSEKIGSAIDIDKLMDIFPSRIELPKMSSLIPEVGRTNFNIEINPSVEINITHGGSMTEEDAKRYGEIASDNTIRKIKEAFAQRGISNIGNAILKQ